MNVFDVIEDAKTLAAFQRLRLIIQTSLQGSYIRKGACSILGVSIGFANGQVRQGVLLLPTFFCFFFYGLRIGVIIHVYIGLPSIFFPF